MLSGAKWMLLVLAASMVALQSHGQGNIRLPDQPPSVDVTDPRNLHQNPENSVNTSQKL